MSLFLSTRPRAYTFVGILAPGGTGRTQPVIMYFAKSLSITAGICSTDWWLGWWQGGWWWRMGIKKPLRSTDLTSAERY